MISPGFVYIAELKVVQVLSPQVLPNRKLLSENFRDFDLYLTIIWPAVPSDPYRDS